MPVLSEVSGCHAQPGGQHTVVRGGGAASDLAQHGHWGKMASLKGTDIVSVEMSSAVHSLKSVPLHRWEEAQVLFG